ncbi:hypothetical protein ABZV65_30810 [Streptomyces bauhiniae]|uniref:hypothetical protein n=1 Tax=Streptomyces bauhiniae TaxID=2340725 RepID=UPI0033B04C7F
MFLAPVDAAHGDPGAWKEIGYVTDFSFTEASEWEEMGERPFAHMKIEPFISAVPMSRYRAFNRWLYPCRDAVAAIEKQAVRWRVAATLAEALRRPHWPCALPSAERRVDERLCCR